MSRRAVAVAIAVASSFAAAAEVRSEEPAPVEFEDTVLAPVHEGINPQTIRASSGEVHVVYFVQRGDKTFVVHDDAEAPAMKPRFPTLVLSKNGRRYAFDTQVDGGWTCVVDGKPGK